eukprot:jgi/Chlat1/3831/Chrsp26S03979
MASEELSPEDEAAQGLVPAADSMAVDSDGGAAAAEPEQQPEQFWWPELSTDADGVVAERVQQCQRVYADGAAAAPARCALGNFLKGVKWSPDGACLLTSSEDCRIRCFDLPADAMNQPAADTSQAKGTVCIIVELTTGFADTLAPALTVTEGETVYDFAWYSLMQATDLATCCFATTTREHPVHMWDAVTGELRCTYRAYDHLDEVTAAYSIAFNPTGDKLFCGYKKSIRVFDTARPGREYVTYPTVNAMKQGQTGIISCMAFNPDKSGMFAAGSYSQTTGLYSEANCEPLFVLHGQHGGITHLQFSQDGNYLYTGARRDREILCWDIRNTGNVLYRLHRPTESTNQRITFDIDISGRYLCTGGEDGKVRMFDLQTGELASSFTAAEDTVNGFAFHSGLPLAATSSGQRRFVLPEHADMEEVEDAQARSNAISGKGHEQRNVDSQPGTNCLRIWRFAHTWKCSTRSSSSPPLPASS